MKNLSGQDRVDRELLPVAADYPFVPLWALLLFCGYVIVWYLQVGERIGILGAIRFEFIYAGIATFVAMFLIGGFEMNSPLNGYLIAYFIVLFIQVPLSRDFDTSWVVFVDRIVKFAFMGFFIVAFVRSPRGLRYFLVAFLLACMKIGQEGFVGKITGSMIWENQGVMRLHGSTSLYGHPNSLSGNAMGTFPFIYFLFPISNLVVKGAFLILALFAGTVVLYSGSRTSYLGFLALLIMIIIKSKKRMKAMVIVTLLSVSVFSVIPQQYIGRFQSIFTQKEAEGRSAETRIEILKDAWQIFKEYPLGIGVGAFPKVRTERFGRFQDTHNLYLEIATNLGIQGFIVFIMLIYRTLKTLGNLEEEFFRQLESVRLKAEHPLIKQHCKDLILMHATTKAVSVFIIIRLVLGLFGMDLYEIYWWFAIGLTIALWTMNKYSSDITRRILTEGQI